MVKYTQYSTLNGYRLNNIIIRIVMSSINLSKRIKELRRKFRITQDKLSKKADIPFSTLAKIEGGYISNPSMETLIKIADAFGIGIDELLGRK
jgi:transcriptional regulator with XRE-family HTH domain